MAKYLNEYDFNSDTLKTQKVGFLSGPSSQLEKYFLDYEGQRRDAIEGTFYLTSDTQQLYIGRKIKDPKTGVTYDPNDSTTYDEKVIPIPINKGVTIVQTLEEIMGPGGVPIKKAQVGEIYYVVGSNILCIYNGNNLWQQINPDTNTDNYFKLDNVRINKGIVVNSGSYFKSEDASVDESKTYYEFNETLSDFSEVENVIFSSSLTNIYYEKESATGTTLVYTLIYTQKKYNDISGAEITVNESPVKSYLVIPVTDLVEASAVGITATKNSNRDEINLSLTGALANNNTVTLKGNNISFTQDSNDNSITLASPSYGLITTTSSSSASISLQKNNADISTINLIPGSNLGVSSSAANAPTSAANISIYHTPATIAESHYQLSSDTSIANNKTYYMYDNNNDEYVVVDLSNLQDNNISPSAQGYYESTNFYGTNPNNLGENQALHIPKISKDSQGHIVDITDQSVILPQVNTITGAYGNSSGQIVLRERNGSSEITDTVQSLFYRMAINDGNVQEYYNQSNLGRFYTADKVDSILLDHLRTINALTYKGAVGGQQSTNGVALPNSNVSVGDVYYIQYPSTQLNNTLGEGSYHTGDLVVAIGDEFSLIDPNEELNSNDIYYVKDTSVSPAKYVKVNFNSIDLSSNVQYYKNTGIIQGNIAWEIIQSGNIDTTYSFAYGGNGSTIILRNSNYQDEGSFTLQGGNKISVTSTNVGNEDDNNKIFTIAHNTYANLENAVLANNSTSSLNAGDSFKIPKLTLDNCGHISSAEDITLSLPSFPVLEFYTDANNNAARLLMRQQSGSEIGTISLVGDFRSNETNANNRRGILVSSSQNDSTISINHATLNTTANISQSSHTLSQAETFSVLSSITTDNFGHIESYNIDQYKAPEYSLGASVLNTNTLQLILYENTSNELSTLEIKSNTLNVKPVSANNSTYYSINLEWDEF